MAYKCTIALVTFAALAGTAYAQANNSYLQRFEGQFRGGGTVQRDVDPSPRRVTCTLDGQLQGANALAIQGTCRAAVIFTRRIGADIRFDPASNSFSGIYTGSTTGPAQLSNGRLQNNQLVFDLTYAKAVYGDRNATMKINNAGDGKLSMIVTDQINGQTTQTSAISLQK
ncbi:hypothetical protein FPY71_09840 [Aureimonas fodinaquatilis]|uniref:Uncharacterized protein n=1 Tax=Aureimonas fodinaquatilis TaxID=2565783 RepID=A0A5B0DZX0_9HYPH|nr:hypothetical protein [Aureimonas fodinaquatilis]KAA0970769.1 hypothetical protein FPY71_09840 [Aureimonas fodinaquatilis]